jgi:hypothetical protein
MKGKMIYFIGLLDGKQESIGGWVVKHFILDHS